MRATTRANAAFWLAWLFLAVICYFNSYDDPSSIFFDPSRAYQRRYSVQREADADAFLARPPPARAAEPADKFLCVGIPSINRTTESFLSRTIATLLDGLSTSERASLHIVVLLADRPAQNHISYGQPWLEELADEVLVYDSDPPPSSRKGVYRTLRFDSSKAQGDARVRKMRLDHAALVAACRAQGAPYFALVEDDVVAATTWMARLRAGLQHVERRAGPGTAGARDWIYVRLFYSELFMGWNSEEWLTYSETIVLVYAVALLAFLGLRHRFVAREDGSKGVSSLWGRRWAVASVNLTVATVFGLWIPALIALYFVAGRVAMHRLSPFPLSGVREMPRYGCCAQGLVFPQRQLEGFEKLLRDPPFDFAGDMMLEGYAGDRGFLKWALDPSVLQHVGRKESSEGPRKAEVWNFSFERMRPGRKSVALAGASRSPDSQKIGVTPSEGIQHR